MRICACQSIVGVMGSLRRADVLKCAVYDESLLLYIYVCLSLHQHIAASVCV